MIDLPQLAHPSWKDCPAFEKDVLDRIKQSLIPNTFFPVPGPVIFKAFEMPLDDVKVVILGLSPYPNMNRYTNRPNACGYAFALDSDDIPYEHWPASLKMIAHALEPEEEKIETYFMPSLHMWREQGVLLLNCSLTCLHTNPTSHLSIWADFTQKLIDYIDAARPGLIYYFMGNEAKSYQKYVVNLGAHIYTSAHPAFWARQLDVVPANEIFADQQFSEIAKCYHWLYGQRLDWVLPF